MQYPVNVTGRLLWHSFPIRQRTLVLFIGKTLPRNSTLTPPPSQT